MPAGVRKKGNSQIAPRACPILAARLESLESKTAMGGVNEPLDPTGKHLSEYRLSRIHRAQSESIPSVLHGQELTRRNRRDCRLRSRRSPHFRYGPCTQSLDR